jgi:hypothetical protein
LTLASRIRRLSCGKTRDLIAGLRATASENTRTVYIPPGLPIREIQNTLNIQNESAETIAAITEDIINSKMGAVVIWGDGQKLLLTPPFPLSE